VVPFVLLLGILVFVHELGHFLVARLNGVKVEVFSLGFGKKLFQFKRGDTVYCLSLIPLGGYVKMFGEQPGEAISDELKAVSFTHKHVLQRISIVLAGPLMNLFFAVFIFGVVATIGEDKRPAVIGDVSTGSKAFDDGFRPGDQILKVSGVPVKTWDDLQVQLDLKVGQSIDIEVKTADETTQILSSVVTTTENPNPLAPSKIAGTIDGLQFISKGSYVAIQPGSLFDSGKNIGEPRYAYCGNYWRRDCSVRDACMGVFM
jgi:regulator of sigma E protease